MTTRIERNTPTNMAKLYATLETSKGKTVSVSDNEEIIATVYEGNMKAYSVHIAWCNVGDPDHWECPECGHFEDWNDYEDGGPLCPKCDIDMKHNKAEMGAIVTTREWRNEPEERRKVKATGEKDEAERLYKQGRKTLAKINWRRL